MFVPLVGTDMVETSRLTRWKSQNYVIEYDVRWRRVAVLSVNFSGCDDFYPIHDPQKAVTPKRCLPTMFLLHEDHLFSDSRRFHIT
jgi:hypothetical protein